MLRCHWKSFTFWVSMTVMTAGGKCREGTRSNGCPLLENSRFCQAQLATWQGYCRTWCIAIGEMLHLPARSKTFESRLGTIHRCLPRHWIPSKRSRSPSHTNSHQVLKLLLTRSSRSSARNSPQLLQRKPSDASWTSKPIMGVTNFISTEQYAGGGSERNVGTTIYNLKLGVLNIPFDVYMWWTCTSCHWLQNIHFTRMRIHSGANFVHKLPLQCLVLQTSTTFSRQYQTI